MYVYAQIDENSICVGISELSGKIINKTMIPINEYDMSILGKKYNKGVWEEVPQPEPQPTQLDIIQEQVYINNESNLILMEAMADQYEQTEAYRLNDMEVQATTYEAVLALSQGGKTV